MGFGVWGLGFGVWGLGFGVCGLEFCHTPRSPERPHSARTDEARGLWFESLGFRFLGFRVWGSGFGV